MRQQRLRLGSRAEEELPSVNITPLIDVVFVILIVFILIAPVLELDKIELSGGAEKPSSSLVEEAGVLAIHVDRDNRITFNQTAVSIERLGDLLKEAKVRNPTSHPQIFHDRRAAFGTYQAIKNSVEGAGFESMDVVLKPGA